VKSKSQWGQRRSIHSVVKRASHRWQALVQSVHKSAMGTGEETQGRQTMQSNNGAESRVTVDNSVHRNTGRGRVKRAKSEKAKK
jgi:hypothetical protein